MVGIIIQITTTIMTTTAMMIKKKTTMTTTMTMILFPLNKALPALELPPPPLQPVTAWEKGLDLRLISLNPNVPDCDQTCEALVHSPCRALLASR
jgi:hypothetical protein